MKRVGSHFLCLLHDYMNSKLEGYLLFLWKKHLKTNDISWAIKFLGQCSSKGNIFLISLLWYLLQEKEPASS